VEAVNVAIIPARGGSRRIPRKNIRPFHGKPILAYSIEAALQSKLFDHGCVWVSTEDKEIGRLAERYGARWWWTMSARRRSRATSWRLWSDGARTSRTPAASTPRFR
jgi:CMP-N-acetylneuraminic acid synthetase